jgi:hypothetical protein
VDDNLIILQQIMTKEEQWNFNKIKGANLTLLYGIKVLSRELSIYWFVSF